MSDTTIDEMLAAVDGSNIEAKLKNAIFFQFGILKTTYTPNPSPHKCIIETDSKTYQEFLLFKDFNEYRKNKEIKSYNQIP